MYLLVAKEINVDEVDESHSEPLQVKTFASERPDQLSFISAQYEEMLDETESKSIGRIRVEWRLEEDADVAQFNLIWFSAQESINQRKSLDSSTRLAYLPATMSKY